MAPPTNVDPAKPEEAVRLTRLYPAIVSAQLPMHSGRAYANLLAAYCILQRSDRAMPTVLLKSVAKAPGMAKLLKSYLVADLEKHPEVWSKIQTALYNHLVPSQEENDDFMTISALIRWPVSV